MANIKIYKRQCKFCADNISQILPFPMFYLKNMGQRRGIQHSQWYHLMANNNLYKISARIFTLALTVSEILIFKMFDLENVGQDHRVEHSMENINICTCAFLASCNSFEKIGISNFVTFKSRSRSRRTIWATAPFHGKYMTFYLMALLMFALSFPLRDMRKTNKMQKKITLKMKA